MADDDLYNLEYLSLVAKITQEIDNHTGLSDKTLAEFVISLHDLSKSLPEFKQKLKDVGADFPESFVQNMDRLIFNMHPKHKRSKVSSNGKTNSASQQLTEQDKKKRMFPGLSKPDQEWEPSITKDVLMKEVDDMMSQFEGAAKKARSRPEDRIQERSPKRQRRDLSMSPPRGRSYGDRRDDRGGRNSFGGRTQLDDRPVLFKIYKGKVSGVRDFGAFVQLEGVTGRVEGVFVSMHLIQTTTQRPVQAWFMYPTSNKALEPTQHPTSSAVVSLSQSKS
jgi:ATP-dependent RNA helicase DHX8/PRP22